LRVIKDSSLLYNEKAFELANKTNSNEHIAYSSYSLGIFYDNINSYSEAIKYYDDAWLKYEELGDKLILAKISRNIGSCYIKIYKEDKGLEYYLKSLSLFKDIDNKLGIANIYLNIGNLYYNEENYKFAIKNINDALLIY